MVSVNETLLLLLAKESRTDSNFTCLDYRTSSHQRNMTRHCISNEGSIEEGISGSNVVVIIIYGLVFFFGTTGNGMVISYFGFKAERKRLFHNYLIHLAVSDLIASTVTPMHFVYDLLSNHVWYLGHAACTIIGAIGPLTVNVSAWLLASIAHERYWGIAKPMKPRFSRKRIHLTAAIIWMTSILLMLPYMESMHLSESRICAPGRRNVYYELGIAIVILILQSVLPTLFMVYAFACIFMALERRPAEHMKSKNDHSFRSHGMDRPSSLPDSINLIRLTKRGLQNRNNGSSNSLPLALQKLADIGSTASCSSVNNFSNASPECSRSIISNPSTSLFINAKSCHQKSFKAGRTRESKQRSCILMLIVTFLVFITCSLPYNLFYVVVVVTVKLGNSYSNLETLKALNLWLSMLVVANSVTNCFIYAGMDDGFREYCKQKLALTKINLNGSKKKIAMVNF